MTFLQHVLFCLSDVSLQIFFTLTSLHLFQLPNFTSLHTSKATGTSGFPGLFLRTAASGGANPRALDQRVLPE
jgi:hypothetical protein